MLKTVSQEGAAGKQLTRFEIEYPLRSCRACPDEGVLTIAYPFNSDGLMGPPTVLPFKPK